MSDTFRKAMLNKLPSMPATRAPWATTADKNDTEELEEDEEEGDSLGDLGQALPPPTKFAGSDLSPISASSYFTQALEASPENSANSYRVYITPPSTSSGGQGKETYLICHHGAGSSALTFAPLAKEIKENSRGELGVLAYDCRGHGKTTTSGPKSAELDLSLQTLLDDFLGLVIHLFPDTASAPSFVLLGHSMGAAPILSATPVLQKKGYTVAGVVVLDVVEGTAVEALPLMKSILGQRPSSFKSVIDSIHWHLSSHSIRNTESARVSVPSILIPAPGQNADLGPGGKQTWRTDLLATEPYWAEWYEGLSSRFLASKCARLLVLAGQERLDKELMVGQMQGKFQLEVMSDTGHYLHEDNPASLASTLVTFWRRNTRVLVLPPKIGSGRGDTQGGVEVKRVGEA